MLEQSEIKTPEYVSVKYSYAGLGSRAVAFMIDQFIMGVFSFVLFMSLFFIFESQLIQINMDQLFLWIIAGAILFAFIFEWSYYILQEFFWNGKTIGKKIVGIRVIQDNGHRITFLSSIIRNLMRLIDNLPSGYLAGMILIFFHAEKKRLGDLTAGTIVVHDRDRNRQRKRNDPVGKVVGMNRWSAADFSFDSFLKNQLTEKDFELVQTYCQRYLDLPVYEKDQLTRQVGEIILPKLDLTQYQGRTRETERILFVLYLQLEEEWSY